YASTMLGCQQMPGMEETALANWEELGTVVGVGTGVCYICVMRGVGGGGRVVADTRGGSAIVVTETSTSEVASVLRVNIESRLVSGLGLSMLETKLDDTEELCCRSSGLTGVMIT
ncbi:hypothetical protein Tco_0990763, partial [Tanacetum coccineum]